MTIGPAEYLVSDSRGTTSTVRSLGARGPGQDSWAIPLVEALRDSHGVLIEGGRIPHDLIEAAFAELPAAG